MHSCFTSVVHKLTLNAKYRACQLKTIYNLIKEKNACSQETIKYLHWVHVFKLLMIQCQTDIFCIYFNCLLEEVAGGSN